MKFVYIKMRVAEDESLVVPDDIPRVYATREDFPYDLDVNEVLMPVPFYSRLIEE